MATFLFRGKRYNIGMYKGQVSLYFIGIMASLIISAFLIINIGKTAKDLTYAENAADASALAGCSVMAKAFNDQSHGEGTSPSQPGQEDRATKNMAAQDKHTAKEEGELAKQQATDQQIGDNAIPDPGIGQNAAVGASQQCVGRQCQGPGATPGTTPTSVPQINTPKGEGIVGKRRGNEDDAKADADQRSSDGREMHGGDSGKEQPNYYDQALVMALKLNFQNSGIQHRLGKLNSKMYEMFLKTITPETVENGMPYTFAWVDGAARFHMVTAIVEIEPCDTWSSDNQGATHPEQTQLQKDQATTMAEGYAKTVKSQGLHAASTALRRTFPPAYPPPHEAGKKLAGESLVKTQKASRENEKETKNRHQSQKKVSKSRQGDNAKGENTNYVSDIVHSRTVWATNFQFHMGSPIKSLIDIDVMTFYPPVAGSAVASFNYTGRGNIHRRGGSGSDPRHECGLIAAF